MSGLSDDELCASIKTIKVTVDVDDVQSAIDWLRTHGHSVSRASVLAFLKSAANEGIQDI